MKRICIYIVLLLATPLWAASRLNPDEHHFIAVQGGVGYQGLLNSTTWLQPSWGVAPEVGVAYRYLRNGLVVQVGVTGEYTYLTGRIQDQQMQQTCVDSEGESFDLLASFTQGSDQVQAMNLYMPVSIGVEHGRFYGLLGAKIGMCMMGKTQSSFRFAAAARYERFIDPFHDMPTHSLESNVPLQSEVYAYKWQSPSVQLNMEIGARLDAPTEVGMRPTHNYRLYLGVYADYGLLNQHPNKSVGELITYTEPASPTNTWGYTLTPAMLSQQMMEQKVQALTIGIKLTCLFELPQQHKCMHCE